MNTAAHRAEGNANAPVLYRALEAIPPSGIRPHSRVGVCACAQVGIVALARRLLIALWRYLEDGVIPEAARMIQPEL